jgi:hypothetical protein
MSFMLIGQLATPQGYAVQYDRAGDAEHFAMPAVGFRRHQAPDIPLQLGHDGDRIGGVRYAERSKADGLLVVATVDRDEWADHLDEFGTWGLSPRVRCAPTGAPLEYGYGRLTEVSIVKRPATRGTRPILWSKVELGSGGGDPLGMPLRWRSTWARAHEAASAGKYRRAADHLTIVDLDPLDDLDEARTDPAGARRRAMADLKAMARARMKPTTAVDGGTGRIYTRHSGSVVSFR